MKGSDPILSLDNGLLSVGMYAMHHMHGGTSGTLVRIDDEPEPGCFAIHYVQILSDGSDVIGGGSSSSWPRSDFRPVTDPILIAAARCFSAAREAHDHAVLSARAKSDAEMWRCVVSVMRRGDASLSKEREGV